jgi:hypothetical protein
VGIAVLAMGDRVAGDKSEMVDRPTSQSTRKGATRPETIKITVTCKPLDVLLGRGRANDDHPGNKYFQAIADTYSSGYNATTSRNEKSRITQELVSKIKETGRFLKYDIASGGWVAVLDEVARIKASQALRYRYRRTNERSSTSSSALAQGNASHSSAQAARITLPPVTVYRYTQTQATRKDHLVSDQDILSALGYGLQGSRPESMANGTERNEPRIQQLKKG